MQILEIPNFANNFNKNKVLIDESILLAVVSRNLIKLEF